MEILTIILASLMSLGSGGGIVLDKIAAHNLGSQVIDIEQQAVRIDNLPNYNVARGKLARVRIASRGILVEPGIRIAALDLETDPLAVKPSELNLDSIDSLRESLDAPVTGAARIAIDEADLDRALQSPEIRQQLQDSLNRLIARRAGSNNIRYNLDDLKLDLRPQNRVRISFKLERPRPSLSSTTSSATNSAKTGTSLGQNRSRELAISLELSFKVIDGQMIRLVDPQGTVNGSPMSARLLNGFATGISDRFNLSILEADGILARILQLEINEDNLQLVGFVRLETKQSESSD